MKYTIIFPLLLLIGTFTINSSFGQYGNLDWNQICNTVEFALYNSCEVLVSSSGQLTDEGERAMGCIRNGLLLGGAAAGLNAPLQIIIPGLDLLSGMTGCSGIVKLDLLSTIGNPSQLLNMLSQNGFTNTIPENDVNENTIPENDVNENTIPQNDVNENTIPQNEFVNFTNDFNQFTNDLYSIDYPSHWEYYEGLSNESNLYFYDSDNPSEHLVMIGVIKNVDKDFDIGMFLLSRGLGDDVDVGLQDETKNNIYLAGYPAIKVAGTFNSETNFIWVITSVNGKTYAVMSLSKEKNPLETNYIFQRMISSFNIVSTSTNNITSTFDNNDPQYSWNWKISDGILTYKVNSSDVEFRNMVDSAFNEWEEKLSPLIVFEKIKYGTANITFNQVQNLTTDKSDNREIEIDNGATILNTISNSSLIESVNINILQAIDVNDELEVNAVIKHEIGHALGLKHSDNPRSIMHQFLSVNYSIKEITLCDAYQVHIINFGKDSDSQIDKNACNSIENIQNDFTNTLPTYEDKSTQTIINELFTPISANVPVLGDDQAKIIIVEFADYQCEVCVKFHKETKDAIIEKFVKTGKVKFLFKDLIVNDSPNDEASTLAASASYCAAEQGKYWEYNDELYTNSQGENIGWVTKDNLKQFASNIGIANIVQFSDCIESDKYYSLVNENDAFAKNIGLTTAPTFIFYNGTTPVAIQGMHPYNSFEQIINEIS